MSVFIERHQGMFPSTTVRRIILCSVFVTPLRYHNIGALIRQCFSIHVQSKFVELTTFLFLFCLH